MSDCNIKISILMPCLNVAPYIRQSVQSVINQSLKDIEIILIDAGSSDGTLEIIEKYANKDSRIQIIHSDKKSYGYQMNLGLDAANGQYIGIVETDDFVEEDMFENLYNLTDNGIVDIAKSTFYHHYDYNTSSTNKSNLVIDDVKKRLAGVNNPFTVYEQPFFLDGHPSIWCGIYKRSLLEDNNIRFMEEPGGGWVDNPFFYQTALKAKKISYCHIPYYYYRESNPDSSSNDLGDFTIPIKRMIDNLNVLNDYGCNDKEILYVAYLRVYAYLRNISRRDNYESHMEELKPYLHKMMLMLDESIIVKRFNYSDQMKYYKYLSPLCLMGSNKSELNLSHNDYELIMKEHNFLLKFNNYYIQRLEEAEKTNKNLNDELEYTKKDLNEIINSKAYKLGSSIASPLRKFRSFKN